jgi:hypothetical protein
MSLRLADKTREEQSSPPKDSKINRIAVCVIVFIVIILIILLLIWIFTRPGKNKRAFTGCTSNSDCQNGQICNQNGQCVTPSQNNNTEGHNKHCECNKCHKKKKKDSCEECDDCMRDGETQHESSCDCDPCKKRRNNWGPKTCTCEPDEPTGVNITFDILGGTATISWNPVPHAKKYFIYRKFLDPTVGKNNYDEKVTTKLTTYMFTGLTPGGAHYFVVTACNECGQSDESYPGALAPSCSNLPNEPEKPVVVQIENACFGSPPAEIIDVFFTDENLINGGYIVEGNGQLGTVSDYFYLIEGSNFGPATNITQKCSGFDTSHTVIDIVDWTMANLNIPPPPAFTGSTFQMKWFPVPGAEEYAVWFVAADNNFIYYYGGFASGTSTTLTLPVQSGLVPVYGLVVGYKLCDKSPVSLVEHHVTATAINPQ